LIVYSAIGLGVILLLFASLRYHDPLIKDVRWLLSAYFREFMSQLLTFEAVKEKRPGDHFMECGSNPNVDYCPEIIVIPTGVFMRGSPEREDGRFPDEESLPRKVTIDYRFAVSKFAITRDEWNTCYLYGGCSPALNFGVETMSGNLPITGITWDNAKNILIGFPA
jgi:formylglycine-generating enzyme required for sulfatase activity